MSHKMARFEKTLVTSSFLRPVLKKFISRNMGGQILKGGVLGDIRAESLSEVSADSIYIFGAGTGNDLVALSKDKIGQIVGIDLTGKYRQEFLKEAARLDLTASMEIGNVLDHDFTKMLLSKYGRPQAIVSTFTLCCIRRSHHILQALGQLLADGGQIFSIEHVADLSDIGMFNDQKEVRDAWMDRTGGADHGGCDVLMELVSTFGRTEDLLIDDIKVYKINGRGFQLATFQDPIVSITAHKVSFPK